jgi:hypothetical protein
MAAGALTLIENSQMEARALTLIKNSKDGGRNTYFDREQ